MPPPQPNKPIVALQPDSMALHGAATSLNKPIAALQPDSMAPPSAMSPLQRRRPSPNKPIVALQPDSVMPPLATSPLRAVRIPAAGRHVVNTCLPTSVDITTAPA